MSNVCCGIVGLPNVGKSTLFNALTANAAPSENYPFCTIEPNVGIVEVKDEKLLKLQEISNSNRIVYSTTQFVDIAGLVEGASKGEGLGNKFLSHIRLVDAICHVVRCFDSEDITHVAGKVSPIDDIEIVNLELILADGQVIDQSIPKIERRAKSEKDLQPTLELLKKCKECCDAGKPLRSLELSEDEQELIKSYSFLSLKKTIYIANVSENDLPEMENDYVRQVREYAAKEASEVLPICAQLEAELAVLDGEEKQEYLDSVGLDKPGLDRLIQKSFKLLNLITFITTGKMETKAWTIEKGMSAPEAAGKIHTDIQKGFIRAEVMQYDDLVSLGSENAVKEKGLMRSVGKEYIVEESDIIHFRHNI